MKIPTKYSTIKGPGEIPSLSYFWTRFLPPPSQQCDQLLSQFELIWTTIWSWCAAPYFDLNSKINACANLAARPFKVPLLL